MMMSHTLWSSSRHVQHVLQSSLDRPWHRSRKRPIQIGCGNFHRCRHGLKIVIFFRISPTCCLTRTSSYGTKFVRTHTLNSKWLDLKGDTMLSVYWTPLRHYLTSRACCATRVTLQFGGALCNEGAVYYLCILWQCMGIWIILVFI